jgi:hypothetical protein
MRSGEIIGNINAEDNCFDFAQLFFEAEKPIVEISSSKLSATENEDDLKTLLAAIL